MRSIAISTKGQSRPQKRRINEYLQLPLWLTHNFHPPRSPWIRCKLGNCQGKNKNTVNIFIECRDFMSYTDLVSKVLRANQSRIRMKVMWKTFFFILSLAAFNIELNNLNNSQNFVDTYLFISYVNEGRECPEELPPAPSESSPAALPL